jgi:acyl-CoA synthetase (AMP-forming)/AMP-acid ligase II
MAASQPQALAVAVANGLGPDGRSQFREISCAELNRRCDRVAHALRAAGIGEGVRTVVMLKPSFEFFALTFALFKLRAVPVLVDPGMGFVKLGQCLSEAEPAAFVGIAKAQLARIFLRWAKPSLRTIITVGPRGFWGGQTLASLERETVGSGAFVLEHTASDQVAAILFTSGSTGAPKGVVYTHGMFSAQVEQLRRVYGITPGEVDLSTFPLFALFGPALGMASVVPEMDASRPGRANPARLVDALEKCACTNLFASPALVDLLGRHADSQSLRLPKLLRVISAGAPASAPALERLQRCLADGVEIFTPYGATECLPVSNIGSLEILRDTQYGTREGKGVCVGKPIDGVDVKIIRITHESIPEWSSDWIAPPGEIGEIVVGSAAASQSYYNRDASTQLAKIYDREADRTLHRMGDVGYVDEQGRLWMCGRMNHRVQTRQGTLYTIPCEAIYNEHPEVRRSALVGIGPAGQQRPIICIELEPGARSIEADLLRDQLRELGRAHPHTANLDEFVFHPGFPVDTRHNAKIFREKLAAWAQKKVQG